MSTLTGQTYRIMRNDLLNASRRVRTHACAEPAWCALEVMRLQRRMARLRNAFFAINGGTT